MTNRAVFLDKDGTLIEDVPYNVDPKQIQLSEGALQGVRSLYQAGYRIFVVTNQSGVALGYCSETDLIEVRQHLQTLLLTAGVPLAGFYYCPHHPDGIVLNYAVDCECRKPKPGLLVRAAVDCNINLSESWFVGDILNDVEAGRLAGCRTILIDNGNETEWELSPQRLPHHLVTNLVEAAAIIAALGSAC